MGLGLDKYFTRTDAAGTRALLTDPLGSTLALTDSSGTVTTEYTYEPFGATTVTGASSTNPYQYTGRENDGTGLYYYRARYYDPRLGRFLAEDPLGLTGGTSLYSYAHNSPVKMLDPTGLFVINFTSNTIYVKPELERTAEPLPEHARYPRDQDGIAAPCDKPNYVYKSTNHVDLLVFPMGLVIPLGHLIDLLWNAVAGGWKGDKWLEERHKDGDTGWDALFAASRPPGGTGRYAICK